ncbi:MAG: hypothetical protein ACK5PP_04085 [Acidimicrobiales bacterium]
MTADHLTRSPRSRIVPSPVLPGGVAFAPAFRLDPAQRDPRELTGRGRTLTSGFAAAGYRNGPMTVSKPGHGGTAGHVTGNVEMTMTATWPATPKTINPDFRRRRRPT